MTEGSFIGSGATAVHERPRERMDDVFDDVAAHRDYVKALRRHLAVLGPQAFLEKLTEAHRWMGSDAVRKDFSPTPALFAAFADAQGWPTVLRAVADVISDAPTAPQAASRA